jgi:hypothetical protein
MNAAHPDPAGEGRARGAGEVRHLPVPAPASAAREAEPIGGEVLEPAGPRTLAAERAPALPAPLAAVVGGVAAALATWALSRLLRPRTRRLVVGRPRRGGRGLEVAGSRSFLVDVHFLRR